MTLVLHDVARGWDHLWWAVVAITGARNESGSWYGWWSGFGADLGYIAVLGTMVHYLHQHNCHVLHCFRLGPHEYDMDGQKVMLCKKHHPRVNPVTAAQVAEHEAKAA